MLQVDGLGAALMQDGKPIEYASPSLTTMERRWAQIEKLLSVVFGLERFDRYTYGSNVVIQNDHKLLASILKKPLSQAPKRLQLLMLRLHQYDVEFQYVEGKRVIIADTLTGHYVNVSESQVRSVVTNALQDVPDKMTLAVAEANAKDTDLQKVLDLIQKRWQTAVQTRASDIHAAARQEPTGGTVFILYSTQSSSYIHMY